MGAPVVFNGVRIGSVTDIVLRYDTSDLKTTIPVTIEIDPKLVETVGPLRRRFEEDLKPLINQGLRARLELQSILTGMLEVGLGYYPDTPVRLVGNNQKYPEIPTIPSQEIMKRIEKLPLEEIAKNVAAAVEGISRLVNSPEITQPFNPYLWRPMRQAVRINPPTPLSRMLERYERPSALRARVKRNADRIDGP